MKVYLVGGAVRDQLLGYPVHERDWVVIGGSPDALLQQGFVQAGRDFPVFLHPQTREEYALGRTERKLGAGYYGFACDFNPNVSLEDDLARRDLTINAMAMDEQGHLIDPFHGLVDLQHKRLRHVSPAFVEDPVRVLRMARFAARYHHLGFTLADETRCLMADMVRQGELSHLVPERVWQEFSRSLTEKNPEQWITVLRLCGALRVVMPELDMLFGIPNEQPGCSLIDSGLQAVDALQKMVAYSDDPILRFAALCHDMGNASTPMSHWPVHQPSSEAIVAFCQRLRIPNDYRDAGRMTARFYRTIQDFPAFDAEALVHTLERCDAFRRPDMFEQLLTVADVISFTSSQQHAKNWRIIAAICGKISTKDLVAQGYHGQEIKKKLHQQRVDAVNASRT